MSIVSALAGPVTRTWTVVEQGRPLAVQLFYNTVTGDRGLNVDGEEVPGTAGRTTLLSAPATLLFPIGDRSGRVTITPATTSVLYTCVLDGAEVPEENSVVASAADAGDEELQRWKVSIDGVDIGVEPSGKPVALFRVHSIRESDLHETTVHRRFNAFVAVDEALRAAYKGSHLLASFPSLPPRSLKFFEDHLAPGFIEKRRWLLQDWLHKLLNVPRIKANNDLQTFLGLVDK
jgi:hypothetical protein